MQKILIMSTSKEDLRAEVWGWSHEDGNQVITAHFERQRAGHVETMNEMPVGMIRSGNHISYRTILHALGDGWKLLAPPSSYKEIRCNENNVSYEETFWSWWLVKE